MNFVIFTYNLGPLYIRQFEAMLWRFDSELGKYPDVLLCMFWEWTEVSSLFKLVHILPPTLRVAKYSVFKVIDSILTNMFMSYVWYIEQN